MNSNTTRKTVRMFDGKAWDTYKVGSKKHRAAEARRAEFDRKREDAKRGNRAQAAWMRENGIVPKGAAWDLANDGERDVKVLKAANVEDGLKPAGSKAAKDAIATAVANVTSGKKAAKRGKKARKSTPAEPTAEELKAAERDLAHMRRVEAGRKGWETRVANGTAVKDPKTGRFVAVKGEPTVEVEDAAEEARTSPKALFWADLSDAGLSDAEIKAAWKIRKRANA